MKINIHAGQRVLYKNGNSGWLVGTIHEGNAEISPLGLFVPVIPLGEDQKKEIHWAEINDIYLEAEPVEEWMRTYGYIMTKEEYMDFVESEDFERSTESSYVSDGEYYYYPVSKFTRNWLMKQPLNYIVRSEV